jgi:hypothetical protein
MNSRIVLVAHVIEEDEILVLQARPSLDWPIHISLLSLSSALCRR